jgi:serine/tyrosine/threonine adenylyltransferase
MSSLSTDAQLIANPASARLAPFVHTYAALPEHFFARVAPTPVEAPRLITINQPLAAELGIDVGKFGDELLAAVFAGNVVPQGATPIAMAYAGHQFGHFVPQLGDGRAILLGEVCDRTGTRRDVQLKGCGRTPFSRNGDGRAALGPVLREYLVSEAMHALGIPATRSLAAVTTGERIRREAMVPGAVLTRVAASHVRVGTFQYFAARGDAASVRQLADYVIERHYPDTRESDRPYLALLQAVTERQARLVARWMQVGFIHGVMNTDNMAVSGETIDFGPCAFMDTYDPQAVFSSIDTQGRYAYANQPPVAQWNLARLAETLLPLVDPVPDRAVERATEVVSAFAGRFTDCWLDGMRGKLGLLTALDGDLELVRGFLELMHKNLADFTVSFRRLCEAAESEAADGVLRAPFLNPAAYDEWAASWRSRLSREDVDPRVRADAMRRVNPAFIPRNHRIEQVIAAAVGQEDYAPFFELLDVLSRPFEERQYHLAYGKPPRPDERVRETFCGT